MVRSSGEPQHARVQVLASFPAQFLFIFVIAALTATGISLNIGGIVLMALGAQWYVLFNVIAAAGQIPTDLREAMDDLGVHGWLRWKSLILPAIAPGYVVGAITAFGGAWNATLVGEVVQAGGTHLEAYGLGAYITNAGPGLRATRRHRRARTHPPRGLRVTPRGGPGRGACPRASPAPGPPGWCVPRR
ncbi:ABC transporter permease subunit [Nocardia tengchongensis]|uniref:ABC transporter permease subunit n=1 Tax=Nocardia tengchongensis TaxID=2055889 RepID=UPI0036C0C2C3